MPESIAVKQVPARTKIAVRDLRQKLAGRTDDAARTILDSVKDHPPGLQVSVRTDQLESPTATDKPAKSSKAEKSSS